MDARPAWMLLLVVEVLLLALAQRRLFGWMAQRFGLRLAIIWAAPATIAHEVSHAAMALALGVPFGRRVGGRVELFRPRHQPDGSLQLGVVHVARTDAIRATLIAIAPVIVVPALLVVGSWLLLGTPLVLENLSRLEDVPLWRTLTWALMMILVPTAAFPSQGDPVGVGGAVALGAAGTLTALGIIEVYGVDELINLMILAARALLLPAAACALMLAVARPRSGRRLP